MMIIKDEKKLDALFKIAQFQLELEGFQLTEDDEKTMKAVMRGDLSRKELIDKLKNSTWK
jgi:hypothetical protein